MLSFRYHVASLVAVLLALAAGIALGGGPLHDLGRGGNGQQLASTRAALAAQRNRAADLQQQAALANRFATAVSPKLVSGRLSGHTVSMVLLPGADPQTVSGLTGLLSRAGANLGGTLTIKPRTTRAADRQLVDALTSQLAAQNTQVPIPAAASTYERLGVLLARVVGSTTQGGSSYDATASDILAGLDTAGLVKAEGQPQRRADLVLVVAGASQTRASAQAAPAIEESVVGAMAPQVRGLVVTGPTSSAMGGGVLLAIRKDTAAQQVSTVDSVDTGPGQIATVLALVAASQGSHGSYGIVGHVSGPMPGVATGGSRAS